MHEDFCEKYPDSVDLQKVIIRLRIPGVKAIALTKRNIAFHETFATVSTSSTKPNIFVVWHEALAGRSALQIALCFKANLKLKRVITHHIFGLKTVYVKIKKENHASIFPIYANIQKKTLARYRRS